MCVYAVCKCIDVVCVCAMCAVCKYIDVMRERGGGGERERACFKSP